MIVVCEGCQKRFQLDDSRIPSQGARVRCKHCKHRFRVPPPGGAPTEAPDPSASAATPDTPNEASASAANEASASAANEASASAGVLPPDAGNDTLFGNMDSHNPAVTGGAPIEGDRSLFGSMEEGEEDANGVSQELRFVTDPSSESDDAGPAPAAEAQAGPPAEAAGDEPEPEEEGPSFDVDVSDVFDEPDEAAQEPVSAADDADASMQAEAPEPDAAEAPEPEPAAAAASEPEPAEASEPEPAAASEPEPVEASEPEPVEASEPEPEPAAAAESEESGGEDAWEFAESNLSFDGDAEPEPESAAEADPEAQAPPEEPAAAAAAESHEGESTLGGESTFEGMELDPGSSHADDAAPLADENPSLRAVGPGAGPDTTTFEMVEDGGAPLELEGAEAEAAPEAPPEDDAPAEAAAELEAPDAPAAPAAAAPEIGTSDDWNWIAEGAETPAEAQAAPAAAPVEAEWEENEPQEAAPAPTAPRPEPDAEPETDDLPQIPPPEALPGRAWLQHAGWALSLVLLLSVAQGTVRLERVDPAPPVGQVELDGLVAENVQGRFVQNARSGMLFVVSGELRNRGSSVRTASDLQVVLLDRYGQPFEGGGTPVAETLAEATLRETPIGALEEQLSARALSRRQLAPGERVAFQAIVSELPEAAVRFRLEAGSG